MTEQVKTGWDRVAELPRSCSLVYSARRLRSRAQGMDRASFICAGLIWLVFHRDAFDKTGTGRLACSACVPHGALRASDCQSTRPFGTCCALQGSAPSLCRPALDCCAAATPPATSLPPHRGPSYSTATQTAADCAKSMRDV